MRLLRAAALVPLLLAAPRAGAENVTRGSETGFIEVPTADALPERVAALHTELRFDRGDGGPSTFGPSPVGILFGLPLGFEGGLAAREGGMPGDPRPAPLTYSAVLKLRLVEPDGAVPGVAVDVVGDRLNFGGELASRLIATTGDLGGLRFGAIAGARAHGPRPISVSPVLGAGAALVFRDGAEAILEGTRSGSDLSLSAGLRWAIGTRTTSTASVTWLPGESGFRVGLGFAFATKRQKYVTPAKPTAPAAAPTTELTPKRPAFADPSPRFRLRIRSPALALGAPRHMQYSVFSAPVASAAAAAKPSGATAAVPTMENILEAQLRERETAAEARRRRLDSTSEALSQRESASAANKRRLDDRERDLAEREARLDERAKTLRARGPAAAAERQLESLEAQLAASERQLAAQAQGLLTPIDAAAGRERDLAARAEAERAEADRVAKQASQTSDRAAQFDMRGAVLAARLRELAAEESRLVARGERVDALDRQLSTREQLLDARQRRLDARSERLDLIDRRAAEESRPATPAKPPAATGAPAKDRPAFTMIVKSPAAIVKEQPGTGGGQKPETSAVHVGAAVEKAVAAATVLTFPTPSAQVSELDREALSNIAKLGANEGLEILVWARAKDPGLMAEATRRAEEIKQLLRRSANVAEGQVVTRITTRPGANGVDVVVSALRVQQSAKPTAAQSAPPTAELGVGETAKRQIREALQSHGSELEACIASAPRIESAEVVLKLTVDAQGVVTRAQVQEGPLATEALRACLGSVAKGWRFPRTGAEYGVDVPITVVAPGRTP